MNHDPTSEQTHSILWDSIMSTIPTQQRQGRPNQVQTALHSQPLVYGPVSAVSGSSVASNSQQGSPIMSPDTAVLTTSSSIQASPEPLGIPDEEQCPPSFQLPESIISRRTSSNSLRQSSRANSTIPEPPTPNLTNSGSRANLMMRRISNRASRGIRRQSSAAPPSRDASVGPCLLRKRSDSNTTAPPEFSTFPTDSESDLDEKEDIRSLRSLLGNEGPLRGSSANSTTGSVTGGSNTLAGPVVPVELQRGTIVKKVSKKNHRGTTVCLVYDPDSSKLTWDKKRPNKFVHLDEVLAVRSGSDVHQYGLDLGVSGSFDTMFTIIHSVPKKSDPKLLHLVAENAGTCQAWTSFLHDMLDHRRITMTSLMAFNTNAISQYWHSEMAKQFGDRPRSEEQEELDIAAVMRLCQKLHIYSSQSTMDRNFYLADVRKRQRLNLTEFLDFVRRMNQRPDIQRVMRSIASQPELGITLSEFLQFVREVQREDVDSNLATWEKKFFKMIRKSRAGDADKLEGDLPETPMMSEAAFVGFMTSKQNGPILDEPQEYRLDRPMNEYFISSSHNTYLLGRQVAGISSIEGYISALVQGCRCVEVDCWDGPEGQPQVVHGRTLTPAIDFKEVIKTINKYAFHKTLFPLWISLEVHCNPAQQAIMAQTIKEIFGSRLVVVPLDEEERLPSPSELMERILIKVKKPRMVEELTPSEPMGRRRGNSLNSTNSRPSLGEGNIFTPSQSLPQSPLLGATHQSRRVARNRPNTINEGEVSELMSSSNSDGESGSDNAPARRSSNKTVQVLGQLGVYCAGVKFGGFDTPDAKQFNHIFSFKESSFAKHSRSKEDKMSLDIHNMRYLMRVYPEGLRVSSSNFDPLLYWRRGVQMAALNWQTHDLGMQLNRAMFEGGTNSSGYVLKPESLRDIRVLPYNADIAEGKKVRSVVTFSIDVLSAQQLMRPVNLAANKSMNPYVEVQVFGGRSPESKGTELELGEDADSLYIGRTEVIRENGFNPMFNDGHFKFKVITKHPDLIFVRWTVKLSPNGESYNHKDNHGVASWTAKLKNLKQGYRTMPLNNHEGVQYLFSTLFCKIQVDPIEEKAFSGVIQRVPEGSKLKSLGGKVFGRMNTSPRTTIEKGSLEKTSFESAP